MSSCFDIGVRSEDKKVTADKKRVFKVFVRKILNSSKIFEILNELRVKCFQNTWWKTNIFEGSFN